MKNRDGTAIVQSMRSTDPVTVADTRPLELLDMGKHIQEVRSSVAPLGPEFSLSPSGPTTDKNAPMHCLDEMLHVAIKDQILH